MSEEKKIGKPLKFKTAEELEEAINKYFEECELLGHPYTITGLALALDIDRKTLCNYEKRGEDYFHTIKKAKLKVENYLERRLITNPNVTGIIFNLKNNFDWKDKTEVEHNVNIKLEDVL